jgi:hypothetical protein
VKINPLEKKWSYFRCPPGKAYKGTTHDTRQEKPGANFTQERKEEAPPEASGKACQLDLTGMDSLT